MRLSVCHLRFLSIKVYTEPLRGSMDIEIGSYIYFNSYPESDIKFCEINHVVDICTMPA